MPRVSVARVRCPRPEHAGSRVKLDGSYGRPGHRRQRYKCSPGGGGRPHVFTELLPREEAWHGDCEWGERHLERREGPKAPRHYQFVARGIAEALVAVGAGSEAHDYRQTVSPWFRSIFRLQPDVDESTHTKLVYLARRSWSAPEEGGIA